MIGMLHLEKLPKYLTHWLMDFQAVLAKVVSYLSPHPPEPDKVFGGRL